MPEDMYCNGAEGERGSRVGRMKGWQKNSPRVVGGNYLEFIYRLRLRY
jgi:hypothetical protein